MEDRTPFTTIELTDWNHAKKKIEDYFSNGKWVFRGQSSNRWELSTSLERVVGVPLKQAEDITYHSFRRRAHHYLASNLLPEEDRLEWLALMQHHGAPTRLLDWTRSPYVAGFFALEHANPNGVCSIWAIDVQWCLVKGLPRLGEVMDHDQVLPKLVDPGYSSAVLKAQCPGIFPIEPYRMNERLTAQQGMFLYPGDPTKSFVDNLLSYGTDPDELVDHVYRFDLPARGRRRAFEELNRHNINAATLFPGIDGFARSLRQEALLSDRSGDNEF